MMDDYRAVKKWSNEKLLGDLRYARNKNMSDIVPNMAVASRIKEGSIARRRQYVRSLSPHLVNPGPCNYLAGPKLVFADIWKMRGGRCSAAGLF